MSIDSVMRNALTGLVATQTALRTTSNNIVNVNTPGYSREEVEFSSTAIAGVGSGVAIGEIRRVVDRFLQAEFVTSAADYGYFDAQTELHDRLQAVLGRPDSESSLSGVLDRAFATLGPLAVEPAQLPRRSGTVEALHSLGSEISRISNQIHSLRAEADLRISTMITDINTALEQVHSLNPVIAKELAQGREVGALQQQRQTAVDRIAELVDLRSVEQGNGEILLFTRSGLTLVDQSLRQLQYAGVTLVDTPTAFSPITLHIKDPSTGVLSTTSEEIYPALRAGSLKGLIDMRDTELPEIAAALGEFAANLVDQINGAHNDFSTVPAPASLVGRDIGMLDTDLQGFTGIATFAVMDANNEISENVVVDFGALAPGATLATVVAAVNAGLATGTMALGDDGLSFSADNAGEGVVILPDATTPATRAGRGFADFFGMNDLMEMRGRPHYDTGLATTSAHGFGVAGTVDIQLRGPGGQVAVSHTMDFATVGGTAMSDVLTDLNAAAALGNFVTFALDANGRLVPTKASGFEDFTLHVSADNTNRASAGVDTGVTFSHFFGVGERFRMDAAIDVGVKQTILDDPTKLALATLDTAALVGEPALTVGDNSGVLAMQNVQAAAIAFTAAGDLPATTAKLSSYLSSILTTTGLEADRVDRLKQDRDVLKTEIQNRRDDFIGVNLDQELANMILFQNGFNAAARLISAADEMFDVLLRV